MAQQIQRPAPIEIEEILNEVRRRLIEAAHPEKIILFGSYARGDFDKHSDLDVLVILREARNRFDEMARLYGVLRGIGMPTDIIVYTSDQVEARKNLRGTMLYHALVEGRILYDAA